MKNLQSSELRGASRYIINVFGNIFRFYLNSQAPDGNISRELSSSLELILVGVSVYNRSPPSGGG